MTPPATSSLDGSRSGARGDVRRHALSLAFATGIALALLLPWPDLHLPERWPFAGKWTTLLPLDKIGHFLLFLAAARPWRRSFRGLGWRHAGLATIAAAAVYGGALELAQGAWTATRSAEVLDALAGALGALAGVVATSSGATAPDLRS